MTKSSAFVMFLLAPLMCCVPVLSAAGEISVTNVAVTHTRSRDAAAEMVINGGLKISGIGISRSQAGGTVEITLPRHISKKGRSFPQVRLLTSQAQSAVRLAITGGKPYSGGSTPLGYSVTQCRALKQPSRFKGIANIVFNDAVEVEVAVIAGRNGDWVLWPQGKKRTKTVVVTDKRLRESIELDILERFFEMQAEGVATGTNHGTIGNKTKRH